jgi:hypothetical protein
MWLSARSRRRVRWQLFELVNDRVEVAESRNQYMVGSGIKMVDDGGRHRLGDPATPTALRNRSETVSTSRSVCPRRSNTRDRLSSTESSCTHPEPRPRRVLETQSTCRRTACAEAPVTTARAPGREMLHRTRIISQITRSAIPTSSKGVATTVCRKLWIGQRLFRHRHRHPRRRHRVELRLKYWARCEVRMLPAWPPTYSPAQFSADGFRSSPAQGR